MIDASLVAIAAPLAGSTVLLVDDGSGGRVVGVMAPWFRHWGLRPVLVESHDEAARFARRRCQKPARAGVGASASAAAAAGDIATEATSVELLPELSVVLCAAGVEGGRARHGGLGVGDACTRSQAVRGVGAHAHAGEPCLHAPSLQLLLK